MKKYTPPVPRPTYFDKGFDVQTAHEFIQKYYPDFYHEDAVWDEEFRNGVYEALIKEFYLYDDPEVMINTLIRDYSWEFTQELWDNIQNFNSFVRQKLKEKEQQWVKDNNIKPPFPVGSKVRILLRYYSETIGVINKIYEYETARYCVLTAEQEEYNKRMEQQGKKERQGGCVVRFEDVELVEE